MSIDKSMLEIRGRLWIWSNTLDECRRILVKAQRAELEMNSKESREKEERYSKAKLNFAKTQPDYVEGELKHSHTLEFQRICRKEFPAFTDCVQIVNYCHMLAVVLFCQLFNTGYEDVGNVAKNDKSFVDEHFDKIIHDLFVTDFSKNEFHTFKDKCITARDKMLGHADGKSFKISHGIHISTMKSHYSAISDIDFNYMRTIIIPLSHAIMAHERQLTVR